MYLGPRVIHHKTYARVMNLPGSVAIFKIHGSSVGFISAPGPPWLALREAHLDEVGVVPPGLALHQRRWLCVPRHLRNVHWVTQRLAAATLHGAPA